ncbi:hypothetical protein EVAR_71125_1 [Eumeta japonica]|uniref:Uncharacterized protein n=1 Tax=Eumeta variegata TaxID=151549 RepID=A0A4C1ZQM5_EUMVA|nr:hypothetical protein EVAR_71125_1 [Eumeta japonica]
MTGLILWHSGCTIYTDDASAIARRAQAAHGTFPERGPGTNSLPYMVRRAGRCSEGSYDGSAAYSKALAPTYMRLSAGGDPARQRTSSSKSDKDNGFPTLTKGAQKLMVVSKKFAKQQKAETTPPLEKAPQQTLNRAETSAATTASAKTKATNERTSVPLKISPPKLLVEVEPMDEIAAQASLKEEISRPSLSGSGRPRLGDLLEGIPRSESRGPRLWVPT